MIASIAHGRWFQPWTRLAAALSLASMLLSAPTPSHAAGRARTIDPAIQALSSPEAVLAWISTYRDEPVPERVPEAVKAMAATGLFRDPERAGVYIGFYAGVLAANQLTAAELVAKSFPLLPEDQIVVIKGIADSGLPDWKALLASVAERMPARHILIKEYLDGKAKPLADIPLDEGPPVLDAWWGYYFATGGYEPLMRIVGALEWADEKENLDRLTIGSMAKWTLANNASRDRPMLEFLRSQVPHQPKAIKAELEGIVRAAERFEVAKLRKDTVAKIEALKAKGPPKGRGWAWWSQIGSTAIAVGCVVAGATGAGLAIGLPCVIGGALSSAAASVLRLEETRQ